MDTDWAGPEPVCTVEVKRLPAPAGHQITAAGTGTTHLQPPRALLLEMGGPVARMRLQMYTKF